MSPWSAEVAEEIVDGHVCRAYAGRRRRLSQVLHDAARWSGRTHLVHAGRNITFAQQDAAVHAAAYHLARLGIGRGDRVCLYGANSPEWLIGMYAALQLGAVLVPLNAWWSPREVAFAIGDADPIRVLSDGALASHLPAGTPTTDLAEFDATIEQFPDAFPDPSDDENEPALILYTSGTTGDPKGAVLSHRSLIANLQNVLYITRRFPADIPQDHPPSASLLAVPLFHLSGLQTTLTSLMTGGRLVFLDGRFEAGQALRLIERERVTSWAAVPTMALRVLGHPDASRRDSSSLRSLTLGGAPVPPELVERVQQAFPTIRRRVANTYGLTESGGVATICSRADLQAHPDSVGRPLPVVEVRIGDADKTGAGEILIRSPGNMSGYWRRPEEQIIDQDGWLHSGDIGRFGPDGFLYIVDRSKDLIIRGGENIASAHVEARLLEHPAVLEVAVVGLPHPILGEEVAAAVVPRDHTSADPAELRRFAAQALAAYEVPSAWWIRADPLPTNAMGKVMKGILRREWPALASSH